MRKMIACIGWVVAWWAAGVTTLRAETALRLSLDPQVLEAFEWFSSLGTPSVKNLTPVEVWTGGSIQFGPNKFEPMSGFAFLAKQEGPWFEVITPKLSLHFIRTDLEVQGPLNKIHYEPRTLDQLANVYLGTKRKESIRDLDELQPGRLVERFLLAWCCWQQGREDLAGQFSLSFEDDWGRKVEPQNLRQELEPTLAEHLFQTLLVEITDPVKTRGDLVKDLKSFATHFAGQKQAALAERLAQGFQSLIDEEATHPKEAKPELAKLAPSERAKELIWRLRDQGLPQAKPEDNNLGELIKIGEPAIPFLIEALDDYRPSRVVYVSRRGMTSHVTPQSISDQVATALRLITNINFTHQARPTVGEPSPKTPSDFKVEVEKWWKEYQHKGTRQFLIDEVASGGPNASGAAYRLIQEFPADAGDAMALGFAKMQGIDRYNFIGRIAQLGRPHPGCEAALKREVAMGQTLDIRSNAAYALRELGDSSAIAPMLKEWEALRGTEHGDGSSGVIRYLASSADAEVIAALMKGVRERPVWVRGALISDLAQSCERNQWNMTHPVPPELKVKIEAYLVSFLDDDEEDRAGYVGYHHACVGDHAARVLANLYRDKYQFDNTASFEVRQSKRWECLNRWRKAAHLTPLAVPALEKAGAGERNKVMRVEFADDLLKNAPVRKALEGLQGKALAPGPLVQILCDQGVRMRGGEPGMRLRAVRAAKTGGITIKVWSIARTHPAKGSEFQIETEMDLAGNPAINSGGSAMSQDIGDPKRWQEFADKLQQMLDDPSPDELIVRAGVGFS